MGKEVLNCKSNIKKQAAQFRNDETILFCARGPNYPIAQEAALKIKELAYMHTQGYAAGELKHGPLALIEPNLSTIFFINNDQHLNKIKSNISEVVARKGKVLMIGSQDAIQHCLMCHPAIQSIKVTQYDPPEALAPFVNVICAQLLAFFVAEEKVVQLTSQETWPNALLSNKKGPQLVKKSIKFIEQYDRNQNDKTFFETYRTRYKQSLSTY